MNQVNSNTAYALWFLWLVGIGGAQRFYTGNFASGVIYFCTWGLFGVGQLIDLALIPGMVDRRNAALKGNPSAQIYPSITLNVGEVAQPTAPSSTQTASSNTPMQKLLKAAKENGGQLSLAQATLHTQLEPEALKQLLYQAQKDGLAEIMNDPETGAVRYRFDVW